MNKSRIRDCKLLALVASLCVALAFLARALHAQQPPPFRVQNIQSTGPLTLQAGGIDQNITLTPSGAGYLEVPSPSQVVWDNSKMAWVFRATTQGCDPQQRFLLDQGTAGYAAETITGCQTIPAGATVYQANTVAGYLQSYSNSVNPVAGYFSTTLNVDHGRGWAANLVIQDQAGSAGSNELQGVEIDVDPNTPNPTLCGVCIGVANRTGGGVSGSYLNLYNRTDLGTPPPYGIVSQPAAASLFALIGPQHIGAGYSSQPIAFQSTSGGGNTLTTYIQSDSAGDFLIQPAGGRLYVDGRNPWNTGQLGLIIGETGVPGTATARNSGDLEFLATTAVPAYRIWSAYHRASDNALVFKDYNNAEVMDLAPAGSASTLILKGNAVLGAHGAAWPSDILALGSGDGTNPDLSISSGLAHGLTVMPGIAVTDNSDGAKGMYVEGDIDVASGKTLTDFIGLLVAPGSKTGSGTVTLARGLVVEAPSFGVTNYAAAFGGKVAINPATAPTHDLEVTGTALVSQSLIAGLNGVTFSATPTFDASLADTFKITLTSNVTSSTLSNATAGQQINFIICQDSGGNHTFVWPTNILGGMTIGSTASKCSAQSFIFDGTNAYALSPGVTNM